MTSSTEVISYLKKNLQAKNYASVFYGGSKPEELVPQSDFDVFVVIKNRQKNKALSEIKSAMDKFVVQNKGTVYSFYKGPIKYRNKGLVHFMIYLEEKEEENENKAFSQDHKTVLKNITSNAKVIVGKHPAALLKGMDLDEKENFAASLSKWERKYQKLIKRNRVQNKIWKLEGTDWELVKIYKKPSVFLRKYLIGYYSKHINYLKNTISEGRK